MAPSSVPQGLGPTVVSCQPVAQGVRLVIDSFRGEGVA